MAETESTKSKADGDAIIFFIDIDGTLTDGTHRELIMEQRGLVIGKYGDKNRIYPQGKRAFLEAFAEPSLFVNDTTMKNARKMMEKIDDILEENNAFIFFLTARDGLHHTATELDLKERNLWIEGARLICKPHNLAPITVDYKVNAAVGICGALKPARIILVDNSHNILMGITNAIPEVITFDNCTDALDWCDVNFLKGGNNE